MTPLDDVQPPGDPLLAADLAYHEMKVASIGKSEAEKAAELKSRANKLIVELCTLMDEGMRDGLAIRWQNIAMNAWGKHEVIDLHIQKRF